MLSDEGRKEAVKACRQWARIRVILGLPDAELYAEAPELLVEFDKQMFRLGEQVFSAEGEVTNVEQIH